MYFKECLGFLLLVCGLGVLCRPMGSCDSRPIELLGDARVADEDDYSSLEDDGGAQEAECADPKAKGDRKDSGEEDKKEADTNEELFEESGLAGEGGIDKRESRYQPNDYQSCDSKEFYDDAEVGKYRDAFGGFPQDNGRGKRVKRSFFYH